MEEKGFTVKFIDLDRGEHKIDDGLFYRLFIVLDGRLTVNNFFFKKFSLVSNSMIILPPPENFPTFVQCERKSRVAVFVLETSSLQMYNERMLSFSRQRKRTSPPQRERKIPGIVVVNELIRSFLESLNTVFAHLLVESEQYRTIKIQEMVFLLLTTLTEEELATLFCHIKTRNIAFSSRVMALHQNYKNASELAKAMNYSLTGFSAKFKQVFGQSPYKWMKEQRSSKIYFELIYSDKSLKDICFENHFNSVSQFTDFCKKNFKGSPARLRHIFGNR